MGGKVGLAGGQDVDGEAPRFAETGVHVSALGDGDHAKRRIERAGHEGIGRHAIIVRPPHRL